MDLSAKMYLHNESNATLYLAGFQSFTGRFEVDPDSQVLSSQYTVFLHVKAQGAGIGHSEPGYRKKVRKKINFTKYSMQKFREIIFSNKVAILLSNYVKNDDKHPS